MDIVLSIFLKKLLVNSQILITYTIIRFAIISNVLEFLHFFDISEIIVLARLLIQTNLNHFIFVVTMFQADR